MARRQWSAWAPDGPLAGYSDMSPDPFLDALDAITPHYRAAAIGIAMRVWAGRRCEGELPPPIDQSPGPPGLCAWCFEKLGDQRSDFNGGTGHPECTRFAYQCAAGDDAMPWPIPEPSVYESVEFLQRLGREAAKLGLDPDKLVTAVLRASGHG